MAATQEIELKLETSAKGLRKVENVPFLSDVTDKAEVRHLTSVYFDTKNFNLRKNGISLRIRSDGTKHVQTIKVDGSATVGKGVRI